MRLPKGREILVQSLDRPGGRRLLAWITSAYASRLSGGDGRLQVFYDAQVGAWGRRALGETVMDGGRFMYYGNHLSVREGTTPWAMITERTWFVHSRPRPGETILDIGAEVGDDLPAFARAVGPTGRVLAVEAHPATFRLLERTVELSGLSQVTCIHAAVMGLQGEVTISDDPSTLTSTVSDRGPGHRVAGLPLDELCDRERIGEISFLKMNIEGAEADALEGMSESLKKCKNLCICCHDFRADWGEGERYRTRAAVTDRLRAAGFVIAPARAGLPPPIRDHVHAFK